MMSDVAKTPREELECKKKYLYEYSMFWECNDGSKCQILEDDVVRLLNEQQATIHKLQDLCGESDGENAKLRIENKKLKAKLKEKEEDERLYANEIVELRKTNEEWLQFKELGGDY